MPINDKDVLKQLGEDVAVLKAISKRNEEVLKEVRNAVVYLQIKNAGIATGIAILVTIGARFLI